MRKKLREHDGIRARFSGTFVRFGLKNGWHTPEKTVLLEDVRNHTGAIVTDHLWFRFTKGFAALDLTPGDIVFFTARVKQYEKGYKGHKLDVYKPLETDYKLSHPTKLTKKPPPYVNSTVEEALSERNESN